MFNRVNVNQVALAAMLAGADGQLFFKSAGNKVRDRARVNARAIQPGHETAIDSEVGVDRQGVYVDVGYNKQHPGFVLWWAEVGTRNQPAQPHLRPALQPGD